jgi:hypothetical protein
MLPQPSVLESYSDDHLWAIVNQRLIHYQKGRLDELIAQGKSTALSAAEQADSVILLAKAEY